MAMRFSSPESCTLYDLNVNELLRDTKLYEGVLESLGSVGITSEHMERMAGNGRHKLIVLLGPADDWDEHGPTVYCAIQVCLEGKIPHMPELDEEDPFKDDIRKYFHMFPQLPYDLLIGMRIVRVFVFPAVPEENYQSTSLKLLARYYNGEVAQEAVAEVPQGEEKVLTLLRTKQGSIHYLATFTDPSMDNVQRWESHGFPLFFVGQLQEDPVRCVMLLALHDYDVCINRSYDECSLDGLFKAFGRIMTGMLVYWRGFDRFLALRILRQNIALVRQGEPGTRKKPWTSITDEERIKAFIKHQHVSVEFVTDLIPAIAESYFGGSLPITLPENEESVLLLMGLQGHVFGQAQEAMNLGVAEIRLCLSRALEAVVDYFNTLSPEVADD